VHIKEENMDYKIRCETKNDERTVEEITRKAFWNIHTPGCNEHYLAHILRGSDDFIPELDLVIERDNQVIGNIMYTKSFIQNEDKERIETITFGPVSIIPEYQKRGYGSRLIEYSIGKAKEMGHSIIIIYGNPNDYCKHGFYGSKKYRIGILDQKYPCALLVKLLKDIEFKDCFWSFSESESFNVDESESMKFDIEFENIEKGYRYSQEEFNILSHSFVE
jgi:putative acetyltransferase